MTKVLIVGVGMTPFLKPSSTNPQYFDLAALAIRRALRDANLDFTGIQQAVAGFCYSESTAGQRALYTVGMTGIPVYNVNNFGCTGGTTIVLSKLLIESGQAECVLAFGFEKMSPGTLPLFPREKSSTELIQRQMDRLNVPPDFSIALQVFAHAGREYMEKYGANPTLFAKVAFKNHYNSRLNPYAQFMTPYTLKEIQESPTLVDPLTKLQCSPTSDGAAAVILCSEAFARRHGLLDQAVEILGLALRTDLPSTFSEDSRIKLVGYDMTKTAAQQAFKEANLTPDDVDVAEVYDCFSINEVLSYEALGLCEEGKAGEFVDRGLNTYGGKVVVNPSGGLISRGHPIGATGIAQCVELCWHLRGMAGERQVKGAKIALHHNMGLGGAAAVGLYKKYNQIQVLRPDQSSDHFELISQETKPKL
mmetsp:Transcript_12980/g.24095  ORF Transcript_12980/g.24095 Transcript_12980/m.24095 type:complete len:420 (+) Transcript_12980:887-2146(+)